MLIIAAFMVSKEQKGTVVRTVLLQTIVVFFVLALMNYGGMSSLGQAQKQAKIDIPPSSTTETEKVVEKSTVPFVKKPVKEDDKSSEAGEKESVIDTSVFDLVDRNIDGYFAIDDVPYHLYQIEPGDTVFGICQEFKASKSELITRNGLENIEHPVIIAGKILKITIVN